MAKQASRQAVVAYLRHRVRQAVEAEGLRPFAGRVGVSHPTIFDIKEGTNALSKAETVDAVAKALGLDVFKLHEEAIRFEAEHGDLVRREGAETTIDYDPARRAVYGSLPGWLDAEREARKLDWKRELAEEDWVAAREHGAADFRGGEVTPEIALTVAHFMRALRELGPVKPQTPEEIRAAHAKTLEAEDAGRAAKVSRKR